VLDWEAAPLPFVPKRFYHIRNTRQGVKRGGHAHWKEAECILALSGSFTILTDNGVRRTEYLLDHAGVALYIPPMTWLELYGFSEGALCGVLASQRYDTEDYCRDYEQFLGICRPGVNSSCDERPQILPGGDESIREELRRNSTPPAPSSSSDR
jgi:hypothetical protein